MTNTDSLETFLRGFESTEPACYLDITESDASTDELIALADRVIADGWSPGSDTAIRLTTPIDWDEVCRENRSWEYNLHAWTPLAPVLGAFELTGDPQYLRFALAIALDWARRYTDAGGESRFAWYDMGTGMRACRLAYIADRSIRASIPGDEDIATLYASIMLHRDVLADEERFAAHSNHGLYFATGQAALARTFPWLDGMATAREQANDRLATIVRAQFTGEGVHCEHSPEYHRMILRTVVTLIQAGLIVDDEISALIERADAALSWLILPNRRLAMLGDTPGRFVGAGTLEHAITPELRFEASGGAAGAPPTEALRVFPRSGYAIVRSLPRTGQSVLRRSYLLQNAAFHSRVHKHADDLSVIWYDHGQEILVDAGRYGYLGRTEAGSPLWLDGFWYGDPARVYVESTRAHNCVEIDRRNHARRGIRPYGSALRRWGVSIDGVHAIEASVRHGLSIVQTRTLVFAPGEFLIVLDEVTDERADAHELVQRFHFAPELDVEAVDGGVRMQLPGSTLWMTSLVGDEMIAPIRGQRDPELLGWISRIDGRLEPVSCAGFRSAATARHVFATLFAFGASLTRAPRCELVNTRVRLAWITDGIIHAIEVARDRRDALEIDHTTESESSPGNTP